MNLEGRAIAVEGDSVRLLAPGHARRDDVRVCCSGAQVGDWIAVDTAGVASVVHRPRLAERFGHPDSETSRQAGGLRERLIRSARMRKAIRNFFDDLAFLEVETPHLVSSPGTDPHIAAWRASDGGVNAKYLITSPEFHMKRLVVGGLDRIYQLGRAYRADESGAWHNPEFTMLEWYQALLPIDGMMAQTEALIRSVASALHVSHFVRADHKPIAVSSPFSFITVTEAFARWGNIDEATLLRWAEREPEPYFETLVSKVEPGLAELGAVFLHHYPAPMASLARKAPSDPRYAERFELYIAGVELCNGFGELTDPTEQRARFKRDQAERASAGLPAYPIDEAFCLALEEGMPPCSGNALGVDRLAALLMGCNAAETMAFPASRP